MDMKKILATLDGVASKPVTGSNDMKKFMSIIRESAVAKESVITSFEADSVGGDANTFLIDADKINDLVMSNIDKIKINADEQLFKDMMSKFNAFMSSYHAVGKEILQPGLFDDKMGVEIEEAGYRGRRDAYQRDYDSSVSGMGKRDSLAYRMDGGANDEGEDDEPRQQRPAPSKGMYFYNVPAGKEADAEAYGLKKTKGGKWYSKTKSAVLDKAFGPGRYWEPKPASEGNEFSGELAKAKASGAKTFNVDGKDYPVQEAGERTMSRAAKGHEKYGKEGMKALAKAGREGASDEQLDKIRDKHDKYDESLSFADYLNLAEAKQKGVDGKVCWDGYKRMGTKKKSGKTVDNCVPTGKK